MSSQRTESSGKGFQVMIPGTALKRTFNGTSAQSAAVGAGTTVVELRADEDCYFKFGADPTASATTNFLAADETRYYGIEPGWKIAVIQFSGAGTLYITEGL